MVHLTTKAIDKLQDIYPGVRVEVDHISAQLQDGNYEILCTTKEEWQKEYELEGSSVQNYRTAHTLKTNSLHSDEGAPQRVSSLMGSLTRSLTRSESSPKRLQTRQKSQLSTFGRQSTRGSQLSTDS